MTRGAGSTPNGIRTRVTALKGRRPRPLDDGGAPPEDTGAPPPGQPPGGGRSRPSCALLAGESDRTVDRSRGSPGRPPSRAFSTPSSSNARRRRARPGCRRAPARGHPGRPDVLEPRHAGAVGEQAEARPRSWSPTKAPVPAAGTRLASARASATRLSVKARCVSEACSCDATSRATCCPSRRRSRTAGRSPPVQAGRRVHGGRGHHRSAPEPQAVGLLALGIVRRLPSVLSRPSASARRSGCSLRNTSTTG